MLRRKVACPSGSEMLSAVWKMVGFASCSMNSGMFWNTLPKYRPKPPRITCLPAPVRS